MTLVRPILHKRWARPVVRAGMTPLVEFSIAATVLAAGLIALVVGLPGGWGLPLGAALTVHGVGALVAGHALHRHYPHPRLGLCNVITLVRLGLTAALVAMLLSGLGASWPLFAVALVALGLDGVDGWLARRNGLVSAFGARFDMEVDAVLALVLAAGAAMTSAAGPLALVLGLPRYLFVLASSRLDWMRRDLPERFSRKLVCVLQLGTLIVLQAPVLPAGLAVPLVVGAVAALLWSFAVDLLWLWRRRA